MIKLENYEMVKQLQGNKNNQIYLIKNKKDNSKKILKIIQIRNFSKQIREVQIHKKLDHKYIIGLIDFEIKDNEIWILLEYAEYGDLFEFSKLMRSLSLKKILTLYYKIL